MVMCDAVNDPDQAHTNANPPGKVQRAIMSCTLRLFP
jgi:hypothetical protein